jgi:hypothetical protein
MIRYRLKGGSIHKVNDGPYIRVEDVIAGIEAEWERQCSGWRSMECESCRTFNDVILLIDPTWKGWDTNLIIKGREAYINIKEHDNG